MTKTYRYLIAGVVAAAGFAGAASAASLVQNGSFEDVAMLAGGGLNHGHFGIYAAIPGWTKDTGAGIELQNNATLPTANAQDGNWYVELDSNNNSSMYQDITFAKAGSYMLSFWYAPRTSTPGDNGISYSLGGSVSGLIDAVYPAGWTNVQKQFTVANDGEILRLRFAAEGINNSYGGFVDNVTMQPVPLPGAALLLGSAVLGLVGIRRRQLV